MTFTTQHKFHRHKHNRTDYSPYECVTSYKGGFDSLPPPGSLAIRVPPCSCI